MPASGMFEKILTDFLEQCDRKDENIAAVLQEFCHYLPTWLTQKGLVGVGHTTEGMALRFADGQEYLLIDATRLEEIANMPAFAITGNNAGSVRSSGAVQDSSVRITG